MAEMSKSPEEIKKGLEAPIGIHYHDDPEPRLTPRVLAELVRLHDDALVYIRQLERDKAWAGENYDLMRDELEQLQRERDAAVLDIKRLVRIKLKKVCLLCANRNKPICNQCEGLDVFEWRGVPEKEENNG